MDRDREIGIHLNEDMPVDIMGAILTERNPYSNANAMLPQMMKQQL